MASEVKAKTVPKMKSCPVCKSKNIWACFGKFVKTKNCRSNEGCFLDFRTRNGKIEMIEMGCKQMKACKNEMKQNGKTPGRGRCRPNSTSWSHCRQCCSGPHCQSRLAPFKFKDYLRDNYLSIILVGDGFVGVSVFDGDRGRLQGRGVLRG